MLNNALLHEYRRLVDVIYITFFFSEWVTVGLKVIHSMYNKTVIFYPLPKSEKAIVLFLVSLHGNCLYKSN